MSAREIHASSLLHRKVVDAEGKPMGRIEELHVEVDPEDSSAYLVREYHLGAIALLEAVAGDAFVRALARLLARRGYRRYVVPADAMDLSDPERPRTRLSSKDLSSGVGEGA